MRNTGKYDRIKGELDRRILLLDGAMGTMIQQKDTDGTLKGCPDLLCLTHPDLIREIHREYLEAGADIITTNTFGANSISLADYSMADRAYEVARAGARLAREETDRYMMAHPGKPRFVAGTMGPTNKTASMSSDIMDPASRDVTFSQLEQAYEHQIEGLLDGGADIILIETVFDTLVAKAAIYAVDKVARKRDEKIPLMISATISDSSGRTLSGQTLKAFYHSIRHAEALTVGLNCAFGPRQLLPHAMDFANSCDCMVSCHPNAGLPNELGAYDVTPQRFAADIRKYLEMGCVNIIGGCCGTTPAHISAVAEFIDDFPPRATPHHVHELRLSNLDPLTVNRNSNFINIGERTNVAGSAKFARLIREGNYAEAVNVARKQIEAGAQVIDVCMDADLIDGPEAMRIFLNLLASEPDIARVPVMIDSSDWATIEAGLRVSQGKCIVNSISLKEGETKFLRQAEEIRRYGAAAVVMLFDEEGQADTYRRKIQVAERSYRLLGTIGFPPEDIIFDPNILTVATGLPEHDRYALDFIRATEWIKSNLPHARVSGGVSNLSFAFRGNNPIREAIHSVFLFHAIGAGMDMAIVNSQMLKVYSEIDVKLRDLVEDLILMRRNDATERLIEYAAGVQSGARMDASGDKVRSEDMEMTVSCRLTTEEKIRKLLVRGSAEELEELLKLAMEKYGNALEVIGRILMPAMDEIGRMFGQGKMFLPQVIKSARVLKEAISLLKPHIEEKASSETYGKVIIATVKGDIHDIGKNIVALVVGCNGYEVTDLGVMADAGKIADEVERSRPIAVMLSGLITPSLQEMVGVVEELQRRGLDTPVIVGGATTSPLHTALKIAPAYDGVVIHAPDASYNSRYISRLSGDGRKQFIHEIKLRQQRLRDDYLNKSESGMISIEEARRRASLHGAPATPPSRITSTASIRIHTDFSIAEVEPYIDWTLFFKGWGMKKSYPEILEDSEYGGEARKLYRDALDLVNEIKRDGILRLQAVSCEFEARSDNEDIFIEYDGREYLLPMLREQKDTKRGECAADLVKDDGGRITLFALTAGVGLKSYTDRLKSEGNEYKAVMAKLIADRLAEAFGERLFPDGCRLAFGYPAVPDHTLKREVFEILDVERATDLRLTENAMMIPEESICGIMFAEREYFSIEKIDSAQLASYARKRGVDIEEMRKVLPFHLFES